MSEDPSPAMLHENLQDFTKTCSPDLKSDQPLTIYIINFPQLIMPLLL